MSNGHKDSIDGGSYSLIDALIVIAIITYITIFVADIL